MMKQAATTSRPSGAAAAPRHRRAAGGDEVVDQDDALALADGIRVDLHLVDAVFERIGDAHGFVRQLALLADRHEPGRELMRHGAAEDEAARLDARDLVDLRAPAQGCTSSSTERRKARASPSSVVMSRKMMPGFG